MILPVLLLAATAAFARVVVPRADPPSPPIVQPTSQSVWIPGQIETIEWITKDLNLTGFNATVLIGHFQVDGTTFLWQDAPLAQNVSLEDGAVNVRVPFNLPTGELYFVSLSIDNATIPDVSAGFRIRATTNSTAYPSLLSTSGNVPPATITRTSVLGTISAAPTSSSESSTSATSSSSSSSSSSSAEPSATGAPNSDSRKVSGSGTLAIGLAGILVGVVGMGL